jgi:transcription antitermination factor NusG
MQVQEQCRETQADDLKWSAVHTHYQQECKVQKILSIKGFQTFLPTFNRVRRWKDRTKTIAEALFPGYMFIANAGEGKLQLLNTPGVCGVVSVGGKPAIIPGNEIESIRKAVSDPCKVEPHPFFQKGDLIRVQEGPLRGAEGILVRKKDSFRLVISVEMLGRSAAVELDACCIEKLAGARPEASAYVS